MDTNAIDIWFGPGAAKGVFGAGVAMELQESFRHGKIDHAQTRLYGSSIGCLTAVFLATGNTGCGLSIFQEETQQLVSASNLVPATGVRIINRLARLSPLKTGSMSVPRVLDLEHIFKVMDQRTPDIVGQLRQSPIPIFAESVTRCGEFRHVDLRDSQDPLHEIRQALNFVPFTGERDGYRMDSVIKGYGFSELLDRRDRPLVIVLNAKPTTRKTSTLSDLCCAALAGDRRIAQLYLRSRGHRQAACQVAQNATGNVLLVAPPRPIKLDDSSGFESAHLMGRQAAQHIVEFITAISTATRHRLDDAGSPRQTLDLEDNHRPQRKNAQTRD